MSYLEEHSETEDSLLEIWLPMVGHEDKYEVSNLGRIKSLDFNHTGMAVVLKTSIVTGGYYRVTIREKGRILTKKVHHLVMAAFVGPRPKGMQINHKDGVKSNNALSNLEYCTSSHNVQHSFDTGLKKGLSGTANPMVKLDEDKVLEIRRLYRGGMLCKHIAPRFGIHPNNVYGIAVGDTWKHVPL